jgi:AcrR family transcriptional regulator
MQPSLISTSVPAPPPAEPARRRRRGAELEAALLEAAWDELLAVGFAHFTMESVAAHAHTGIAVLYRRWANKGELVLAAIEHYHRVHPLEVPDTGTLRGDLIGLMTEMSTKRSTFVAVIAAAGFSGLLADTGLRPGQMRERFLGDPPPRNDLVIYRRAQDRGELDLERIPPDVLTLPFELVRHDLLMNLEPVAPARIRAIVDELVLPLIQRYR